MSKIINKNPDFSGPFKKILPEYINYKRAQGYKWGNSIICRLKEMDLFFKKMGIIDIYITREMYETWTKQKPKEKATTTAKRCTAIRGFARYLVMKGYNNIYSGFDDTRTFKTNYIPYIFSKNEITSMFKILADRCIADPSHNNETFQLIMQIYYCCGLRKSELQNIKIQDVDFKTGKVTILHGKNNISRIIIVSDSLLIQLQKYQRKYLIGALPEHNLFHGENNPSYYSDYILYKNFHQLLDDACIKARPNGKRQHLHDIRHTFCIRTLEQMHEKEFDFYTTLPLLSTYLGHKHITETEYYLRMLEEHFASILEKSKAYNSEIFPSVYGGVSKNEK